VKDVTRIEALGDGRFRVHGALAFGTVMRLLKESRKRFAGQKRLLIDLSTVAEGDSAGLSLLLEWLRSAREAGQDVSFTSIPAPITALSRIGEVDDLLEAYVLADDQSPRDGAAEAANASAVSRVPAPAVK
jgi:phospholipid transport system transporter-binding protein